MADADLPVDLTTTAADEAARDLTPGADPPAPPPAPTVDEMDAEMGRQAEATFKLVNNAGVTPDKEAKARKIANERGIPVFLARQAQTPLHESPGFQRLARIAPATVAWFTDPSKAAIAMDSADQMAKVELLRAYRDASDEAVKRDELAPAVGALEAFGRGYNVTAEANRLRGMETLFDDTDAGSKAAELEKGYENFDTRLEKGGALRSSVNTGMDMAGLMANTSLRSGTRAVGLGLGAAGVAAIAGQAGPQVALPEEIISVPAAFSIVARTAFKASMATDFFLIEAGAMAQELRQIKDMNGQPLDPGVIKATAAAVGLVNAAGESLGFGGMVKSFLKTPGGKAALVQTLADQTVLAAAKSVAARMVKGVAVESATEMAQEFANILGARLAIAATSGPFAQEQTDLVNMANINRIVEAGWKAAQGASLLGAAPSVVSAAGEVRRAKQAAAFLDVQDKTNAAIQEMPLTKRDPAAAAQFMQEAGLGGYADLSPVAVEKIPEPTLLKLGITPEMAQEARDTGQALRIRLEDVHTKLEAEEYQSIRPAITEIGGVAAVEAEQMDMVAEMERGAASTAARAEAQDAMRVELRRLRGETQTAVMNTPRLREMIRNVGVDPRDFVDDQMALLERQALTIQAASGGKAKGADFLKKVSVGAENNTFTAQRPAETFTAEDIDAAKVTEAAAAGADITLDGKPVKVEGADLVAQDGTRTPVAKVPAGAKVVVTHKPQGTFTVSDGKYLVKLFDGANLSTIAHEGAHAFLTDMIALIKGGLATEAFRKDWAKMTDWLGVDPSTLALTDPKFAKAQEQFARGWEEYLREGKAPSASAKPILQRFSAWLTRIYRTAAALGQNRVELTDEVRAVFDRLMIQGEEIESSSAVLNVSELTEAEAKGLGLLPAERDRLDAQVAGLRETAKSVLLEQRNKDREARRKAWREQAEAEVTATPIYQAMESVKKAGGLNAEYVLSTHTSQTEAELNRRGLIAETGGALPQDIAAELRGAVDPDTLVNDLVAAKSSVTKAIGDRVNELEAAWDSQNPADAAVLAGTADYIETLRKAASKAAEDTAQRDPRQTRIESASLKTLAQGLIRRRTMREAINVFRYQNGMRDAMRRGRWAAAAGKRAEALQAFDQALLHLYMAQEAQALRNDFERFKDNVPSVTRAKRGTVEGNRHMAAFKVLAYIGAITPERYAKEAMGRQAAPLAEILVNPEEGPGLNGDGLFMGLREQVDAWGINQKPVDILDQNVDAYEDIGNLLDHLMGTGRDLVKDELRALDMKRDAAVNKVTNPGVKLVSATLAPVGSFARTAQDFRRQYFADGQNLLGIFSRLDGDTNPGGGGTAGPNESILYQPLARASERKQKLLREVAKANDAHIKALAKLGRSLKKGWSAKVPVPQRLRDYGVQEWTFEMALSLALNAGNNDNMSRLRAGYPDLTDQHIADLLSVFSDSHWDNIRGIAESVQVLWPESVEVFERVNHFKPRKLDATPFTTPTGKRMKGWYWPVRYDGRIDRDVAAKEQKDAFFGAAEANFSKPKARDGSMQARGDVTGKPVLLSMSTLARHVDFQATYIAYAEVLRDIDMVTNDPAYMAHATKVVGEAHANAIRPSLKGLARKPAKDLTGLSRLLENMRGPATAYALVGNWVNTAQNLLSVIPALGEHGLWFMRGMADFILSPRAKLKMIHELSATMAERTGLIDPDIAGQASQFSAKTVKGVSLADVKKWSFVPQYITDAITVYPVWLGVYQRSLQQYGRDLDASEKAVAAANEAVARLQGSGRDLDASAYTRDKGGLSRVFTMFSTFTLQFGRRFSAKTSGLRTGNISPVQYATFVSAEIIVPSVAFTLFVTYIAASDDKRKKLEKDPLWQRLMLAVGTYPLQGLPFFRDIASSALGMAGSSSSFGASPLYTAGRLAADSGRALLELAKDIDDEKKQGRAVYAMAEMVSLYFGLPVPKVAAQMFADLDEMKRGK